MATAPEILIEEETPSLHNGDHLTRAEFERRYRAMPDINKAELIEGVVYMPSPVRADQHGVPHGKLSAVLGYYVLHTPHVLPADNTTIRLDLENEFQPDLCLFIDPKSGGRPKFVQGYLDGGPELVCEVAASSASIDLNLKFRVYRRNQVQEYLVWRVLDQAIDWFVWREGVYDRLPLGEDGVYRSEVFPGLWLDAKALVQGDLRKVLQILDRGLACPEHAAFVEQLESKRAES